MTTAAAAWVVTRSVDDPTRAACYRSVNLGSDIAEVSPAQADPITACARQWEVGAFARRGEAPALEACVLATGIVGVFPIENGDPCGRLGLDRWSRSQMRDADPVIDLQTRLAEVLGAECVPLKRAHALITHELEQRGMQEWSLIEPANAPNDRPCASVGVDVAGHTITLVPIPAQPGG